MLNNIPSPIRSVQIFRTSTSQRNMFPESVSESSIDFTVVGGFDYNQSIIISQLRSPWKDENR